MKSEYHLFIIWENARNKEVDILYDIENNFEVLYKINTVWSKEYFSDNLTRFYGTNLPPNSGKEQHIGTGEFLIIIVKDKSPKYSEYETSNGKKYINSHTFLAKTKYRDLTGGGHKIHGTNTPAEFSHDFALLFGCSIDNFMKKHKPIQDDAMKYKKDLVGSSGWKSLKQVFDILNLTEKYIVMRNFEPLPDEFYAGKHGDIDFLVRDYDAVRYILNAVPVFSEQYRVHNKITVAGEEVFLDLRYIGDGYYDKDWQKIMLKDKIQYKNVNIMDRESHFYSLLYHTIIHKPEVAEDYIITLDEINKNNHYVDGSISQSWFKRGLAAEALGKYLAKNNYEITKPEPSVYFNLKNMQIVNKVRESVILKNLFNFDSVNMFHVGPQADERRYYKAMKGDNALFVKSGSRDYEREFIMAKMAYDKNPKYFVKPTNLSTGKVNYFVTEWVEGVGLDEYLKKNKLTKKQIEEFTEDMYEIHKTLWLLKIVHRDLIPRNFIVTNNGHLKLIDFYWAVKFDDYNEYDYVKKDIFIINNLGEDFAKNKFVWDDSFSFIKLMRLIGADDNNQYLLKVMRNVDKRVVSLDVSLLYDLVIKKSNDCIELGGKVLEYSEHETGLKKRINALEVQNHDLQKSLRDMQNSNSWKMTKPVRSIMNKIKGR